MKLDKIKLIDIPRNEYSLSMEEMGKLVGAKSCLSYLEQGKNKGTCISFTSGACNGSAGTLCDRYTKK